jgi:anti-sigma factor ChrR (cupin superfamily)
MQLNSDLSQRAIIRSSQLDWVPSPAEGIHRKMLERDGDEIARATSIVRYAQGSQFPTHTHGGGEEILVLEGVFEDEHGSHPAGTYLKNPVGTSHAPGSSTGCTLFVKLRHMDSRDTEQARIHWPTAQWRQGLVPGLKVLPLAEFETQHTALVRWAPGTVFNMHRHMGGEEIFVIEGSLQDENGVYRQGDWIRSPHLSTHKPSSPQGCLIFVKTGHLFVTNPPNSTLDSNSA